MEKKYWSEYGKYLVLADNSRSKLKNDFGSYLKFKKFLLNHKMIKLICSKIILVS